MIVRIEKSSARGIITAPPSKSYTHRYLIAAALAGNVTISNVVFSNDINATIRCLASLGYKANINEDKISFIKTDNFSPIFDCGESGSTLRFMIPIVMSTYEHATFIGSEKLFSRGISVYEDIFKEQGIDYKLSKDSLSVNGKLKSGYFKVQANISSQFITGLLFASTLLDGDSSLELVGEVSSKPYIDITLDVLKTFGIIIENNENVYFVKGGQTYKGKDIAIEGDYSNSAFLDVFNYLGGRVKVEGLRSASKQGDKVYKQLFYFLNKGKMEIDLTNAIDLGPILFTFAAIKHGAIFTGIERLRIKESDRVSDMLSILKLFGVRYLLEDNRLEIFESELHSYDKIISPANDHRIVMSTAVLLTLFGGKIANAEAVNKSFPDFFSYLRRLGIGVSYENI